MPIVFNNWIITYDQMDAPFCYTARHVSGTRVDFTCAKTAYRYCSEYIGGRNRQIKD